MILKSSKYNFASLCSVTQRTTTVHDRVFKTTKMHKLKTDSWTEWVVETNLVSTTLSKVQSGTLYESLHSGEA